MNVCVVNLGIVLVTSPEAITPAVFYSWWRLNSGLARAGSGWRRSTLTIYHTLRQDTSPSGSKPPRRHTSPLAVCCRNLLTEVKLDASPSLLTDKDPDLLQSPLSSPVRRRPTHTASYNWTGEGNEDRRSLISSSVAFLSLSLSLVFLTMRRCGSSPTVPGRGDDQLPSMSPAHQAHSRRFNEMRASPAVWPVAGESREEAARKRSGTKDVSLETQSWGLDGFKL